MGNVSLLNVLQGLPLKGYDCATEMKNLKRSERDIFSNSKVTEAERALLIEMNDLAKQSVQLNCGLFKPEAYDYCEEDASRLDQNEINIKAALLSDIEHELLLEMNLNARKSLALNCTK